MTLAIRMILYFCSSFLAGMGVAVFNEDAGTLTLNLEQVTSIISGALVFVATFVASRFAKPWKR